MGGDPDPLSPPAPLDLPMCFFALYLPIKNLAQDMKKQASMIRKYHNHKLQTNPSHREVEPHKITITSTRKIGKESNLLSLSIKMIEKLERKQRHAQKHGKHRTRPWEQQSTPNQQQQNRRLRTNSSLSHWGWGGHKHSSAETS